jgi:signal transduction histidine kinase
MHWGVVPDIVADSLVVLVFLSIYRKRQSPCTWNWIAGWIFIDLHFGALFLLSYRPDFVPFSIFADSSLIISGVIFFLATVELSKDFDTQRLIALSSIVPSIAYITLLGTMPRPLLLECVVLLGYASLFATAMFYFQRRGSISYTILLGGAVVAAGSFIGLLRGDLDAPVVYGLAGIYCGTALSYWKRFERFSTGVVIAVIGFFAWASVFPMGDLLEHLYPGMIPPNSPIWNIPKYFVAGAMILTLLEDEIAATARIMHRYRLQFDRSLCGVYRCTVDGQMLECNDAFVSMLQRSRNDIFSTNLVELFGGAQGPGGAFVAQLERHSQVTGTEITIPTASGSLRYLIGNATRVIGGPGEPSEIEGAILDITDFKTLQDQIRDSQKLEAIGLLAGGVAHDFNNLLMVISGHIELLEALVSSNPRTHSTLEAVKSATQRGAAITGQLLAFSRKGPVEPRRLDINAVLEDARSLLKPVFGEQFTFEVKPGQGRFDVMADENQIILVLLNMAINARDAMPNGGRILLESSTVDLDESLATAQGLEAPGHYVCISVSDTGMGIPPDVKARVFEPFFTTKPQGKGTGLGLSICYGIIQQHHGNISIASSAGIGTTVRFYLPMVSTGATASGESRPVINRKSPARILLVDDEEMLRKPACTFFQHSGFDVAEASSSDEALRLFEEKKFDLVITDMVMPGMNGRQLGEALKKRSPQLPVIYISGYAQDILENQGRLAPGDILLQKPYSLKRLVRIVEEALEERDRVADSAAGAS